MFQKLAKNSLVTPLFHRGSSSFSSLPVTFRYFKNTKDNSSRFIVRQMVPSEVNEVANSIADVYLTRENVLRTLNIPKEEFVKYLDNDLKQSAEHDLAIVCRDEKTNKLAGAFYCQDMRTLVDEKILFPQELADTKWMQFEDFYKSCLLYVDQYAMPKGLNDILYCKRIAVCKEYSQLTVGNNLMYVARFLHPKITRANRNIIIATHEYTYNFCKMNGFELVKKISYKNFRDRNNVKPFEKMTKLQGRTEADEFVYVMKRERENKNFFQEIKKVKV